MTALPFDIASCPGVGSDTDGWCEGRETCLRRTAPGNPHGQWYMEPPAAIAFFCPRLIEPGDLKERKK